MRRTGKFLASLSIFALSVTTQLAGAEIIQFENTTPSGQVISGTSTSYTESGYTIGNLYVGGYLFLPPGQSAGYGPQTDTTSFGYCGCGFSPTLARTDNQLFTLNSLDIGLGTDLGTFGTFTLIGQRGDSTTFNYGFIINDFQWHHLSFENNPNFTGLTSLSIYQTGPVIAIALDNINVSQVPIPASAWLLGSGLVGLVGKARRKQSNFR